MVTPPATLASPPEPSAKGMSRLSALDQSDAEIAAELITLRDYLRLVASEFHLASLHYGHGTDSPWDEAVALCLGALHLPWNVDPAVLEARLLSQERLFILSLMRARVARRAPLPYLLGEAFFAGFPFDVDERVLIPRSPIAELIEDGFSAWFPEEPPRRVLDLCTGSGCIGIATALYLPTAEVVLADISADALAVADGNIDRHHLGARVKTVAGDLFEALQEDTFDLIVSNPPYVDSHDVAAMPAEYAHEPALALGAGDDGLSVVRRILREARRYLNDDGWLIVEVGNSDQHLEMAYPQLPFVWLAFERGGQGVFALSAADLDAHAASLA